MGARAAARAPARRAGADAARARGGPPLAGDTTGAVLVGAAEQAPDEAGFETAHLVGNLLGGYLALQLAARDRARSVVALAPAGGWAEDDDSVGETLALQLELQELARTAAARADAIVAAAAGRRQATSLTVSSFEHIPADLLAHQIRAVAGCDAAAGLIELAAARGGGSTPSGSSARYGSSATRRLGRARRRRPLPAARPAARDGAADPRLHGVASTRQPLRRRSRQR